MDVEYLRPIRQGYKSGEALVFLQPLGLNSVSGQVFEVGDLDGFDITTAITRKERFSSQEGPRILADSQLDTTRLSISFTLLQMTQLNRALAVGAGKPNAYTQAAAANGAFLIANAEAGAKYWLGDQGITVTSVAAGATVFPPNTYEVDGQGGFIQLLAVPEEADLSVVTVTYSRRVIVQTDKVFDAGLLSAPEAEYRVFVRGTHKFGPKALTVLNRVRLAPDGARAYIGADYSTVTMSGDILPDDTMPLQYQFGYERDLILPVAA